MGSCRGEGGLVVVMGLRIAAYHLELLSALMSIVRAVRAVLCVCCVCGVCCASEDGGIVCVSALVLVIYDRWRGVDWHIMDGYRWDRDGIQTGYRRSRSSNPVRGRNTGPSTEHESGGQTDHWTDSIRIVSVVLLS